MTAIHRREMLGVDGAVVATAGLALMPVPAESAPLIMSKSSSCYDRQPRRGGGSRCAPPPQPLGTPPSQGVSTVLLALMAVPAEFAPLTMSKSCPATTDNLVEEAVVVVRRRRRVRVCRWHRGRRVCRWRWI